MNVKQQNHVKSQINANGRIVIPFRIRRAMGLEPGDTVTMVLEDGILRIEPYQARLKRIQAELKKFVRPGAPASDELAAERREESHVEMEEWLG
jgi:antitoxin PrlF